MYLEPWSTEDGKQAFFRNLRRLNKEYTQTIADELSNLSHQMLIVWGDQNAFQKPEYAPKLAEAIPNTELIWIKNVGHWLIGEKPAEIGGHINEFFV